MDPSIFCYFILKLHPQHQQGVSKGLLYKLPGGQARMHPESDPLNIYINELDQSAAQDISLTDTEVKCRLYADDLVLLTPL